VHVRSTDGGIDVTDSASRLPEANAVGRPLLKFLAGWLYGGLLRMPDPREDPGITVFLPVCESCFAQRQRVRVTAISWHQRSVTVLASQSFARHLQRAHRGSSPSHPVDGPEA
jgi:hypothetical protein